MKFLIPKDASHSAFRLTARIPEEWEWSMSFDNSSPTVEFALPEGIDESNVEVFLEPMSNNGRVDTDARKIVLKTAVRPRRGKHGHRQRNSNA